MERTNAEDLVFTSEENDKNDERSCRTEKTRHSLWNSKEHLFTIFLREFSEKIGKRIDLGNTYS